MSLEASTAKSFSDLIHKAELSIHLILELLPPLPPKPGGAGEEEGGTGEEWGEERVHNLSIRKLHEDLRCIGQMFGDVTEELQAHHTFTSLEKCVAAEKEEQQRKAEFIALLQGQRWRARQFGHGSRLRGLQQELRAVQEDTHNLMREKDKEISELLAAIADAQRLNPRREEYEKKAAEVQLENLHFLLEREERITCQESARVGREIPQEVRVHAALTSFLQESCARLEARKEEWRQRFASHAEEKGQEVAKWRAEVEGVQQKLAEVTQRHDEMKEVVERHEAEEEAARHRLEEEKQKHDAAAKIQAWWRGTVVRWGLSASLKKKNKKGKPAKK
ncbi:dynein regulatory complex protein 9-like [Scylla paramamosain]|uniref:dynein regulatory complex protein 9-like n=1 Tax=Scylla paramamosain TaxID=85552 RepID=UPI003082E00F